jgi:hypothetical protein
MTYHNWAKQEYPYNFQEDRSLDEALEKFEMNAAPSVVKRREDQSSMFELEVEDTSKRGKVSPSANGPRPKEGDDWSRFELLASEPSGATALRRDTEFVDKLVKGLQNPDPGNKEKKGALIRCLRTLSLVMAKGKYDASSQDISNASPLSNLLITIVR